MFGCVFFFKYFQKKKLQLGLLFLLNYFIVKQIFKKQLMSFKRETHACMYMCSLKKVLFENFYIKLSI